MKRQNNLLRKLGRCLTRGLSVRPHTLLLFVAGFIVAWAIVEVQVEGLIGVTSQLQDQQMLHHQTLNKANDRIVSADEIIMSLRQRLNISVKRLEVESQITKDELISLRDGLMDFLNENSRTSESVNDKLGLLEKQLSQTTNRLVNNLDEVYRLKETLDNHNSKPEKLYESILLPSVRVKTRGNVGGGVIIYSAPLPSPWRISNHAAKDEYQTYILSAYHVVKGLIYAESGEDNEASENASRTKKPIEVVVEAYRDDFSGLEEYKAVVVTLDEAKDLAILRLKTSKHFKHTAKFISKDKISQVKVFTSVYAVGCPLGYEPLPTAGEIANLNKQMHGEKFWLMNAPTIFGNSGGGIFLADTYELIGISSMVCVYNQVIPTPVPHLGLMVPPDDILKWLDGKGLEFLYNPRLKPVLPDGLLVSPLME